MAKKILIVDDEVDLRKLIQTCLEVMKGWQAVIVGSGVEALKEAQNQQLDLILLDLMMPDMDGLATLKQLRSQDSTRQIPVVLLTAKGRSINSAELAQLKVLGMIRKPFDPMKLAEQIEVLLETVSKP